MFDSKSENRDRAVEAVESVSEARAVVRVRVTVTVTVRVTVTVTVTVMVRVRVTVKLGGEVVGSVLVATPGSVHGTFFELQLLIMPQHHIYIPPRPLLFRRYEATKK